MVPWRCLLAVPCGVSHHASHRHFLFAERTRRRVGRARAHAFEHVPLRKRRRRVSRLFRRLVHNIGGCAGSTTTSYQTSSSASAHSPTWTSASAAAGRRDGRGFKLHELIGPLVFVSPRGSAGGGHVLRPALDVLGPDPSDSRRCTFGWLTNQLLQQVAHLRTRRHGGARVGW